VSATGVFDEHGAFVMSRSVMYDITELHRARNDLERINREQAAMLDSDLVGIAKLRNRHVVWRNRAFDRMFGYEPGELVGAPTRIFFPDDASCQAQEAAAYAIVNEGGRYRTQLRLCRKSGEVFWVDLSGVLLSDDESLWLMIDITTMKEQQQRTEALAFHDPLTGLPNRLLLADRMRQALLLCARLGAPLAVCYVDLDRFKEINDELGHDAGDRVLRLVAERLRRHVRANDTLSRVGGDEFVLVLAPLERDGECEAIVDRILAAVGEPIPLAGGASATVSASIGVAFYPRDASDVDALVTLADQSMYEAKRAGRNRIRFAARSAAPADTA
jgi:diguanylate cyclase (GGDEF)-like protein/PAS domain S-box-containing protein